MTLVVQTPKLCKTTGDSSQSLPRYPWTRDGFKLPKTRRELEQLSQEIQKVTPLLPISTFLHLKLGDSLVGLYYQGPWTSTRTPIPERNQSESRIASTVQRIPSPLNTVHLVARSVSFSLVLSVYLSLWGLVQYSVQFQFS